MKMCRGMNVTECRGADDIGHIRELCVKVKRQVPGLPVLRRKNVACRTGGVHGDLNVVGRRGQDGSWLPSEAQGRLPRGDSSVIERRNVAGEGGCIQWTGAGCQRGKGIVWHCLCPSLHQNILHDEGCTLGSSGEGGRLVLSSWDGGGGGNGKW